MIFKVPFYPDILWFVILWFFSSDKTETHNTPTIHLSFLLLPAIQKFVYLIELKAVSIKTFQIPATVVVLCPCTVLSEWRNHTWAASLQASTFDSLLHDCLHTTGTDSGSVSLADSVDSSQLLRDPSQEDGNKSSAFFSDTYAKCILTFLFLCDTHSIIPFKHFPLLCCIQNKGNRENWEI